MAVLTALSVHELMVDVAPPAKCGSADACAVGELEAMVGAYPTTMIAASAEIRTTPHRLRVIRLIEHPQPPDGVRVYETRSKGGRPRPRPRSLARPDECVTEWLYPSD